MRPSAGIAAARQRGALLLVTLIMLSALSVLGTAALQAAVLEQRMAGNIASQQAALAAADHALNEVERQFQNAVLEENKAWLAAAATGQALSLPSWNVEVHYAVVLCCETLWDPSQPLSEDNVARLYHISVQAMNVPGRARAALQSTYLIASATAALPQRGKRVAWRYVDPAF